jgi:hypothetical protein
MESIVVDYWGNFEWVVTRIELFIWSLFTVNVIIVYRFRSFCQYDRHSYTALKEPEPGRGAKGALRPVHELLVRSQAALANGKVIYND